MFLNIISFNIFMAAHFHHRIKKVKVIATFLSNNTYFISYNSEGEKQFRIMRYKHNFYFIVHKSFFFQKSQNCEKKKSEL